MNKHERKGETVFTPPEWFEEDCEVAYVFLAFPELFPQYQEGALKTAQAHYPIMYQKIMELS